MTQDNNQNILYTYTRMIYIVMLCFSTACKFKQIDPKNFKLYKYSINSTRGCLLEVDLKYPKELRELYNDYPLAPDKIEIKKDMMSNYQLKIADFYKFFFGNVKELVSNFFDKEKYMVHYENLQLYLRPGLKLKKYIGY